MYNLKITSDQGKDDTSTNRTSSSKPTNAPRSDKDFKKILGEKERGQEEGNKDPKNAKSLNSLDSAIDYEEIAESEENLKKQQPSLFDLSKGNIKKASDEETSEAAKMASADELPMESPTSIFKNLALKEKAKGESKLERTDKKMGEFDEVKDKTPTRFPQESIDLSYVNPLALSTTALAEVGDQKLDKTLPTQKITIQQLVDALVKAINTVESQGKSDTVVTLKHPPLFAGANVVLSSYETAKGEFNIRFENLTQQAQTFLNMQQNQESLLFALQQKGYAVHIMVATTQVESPQIATSNPQQETREGSQDQQQQQQGRRQKDEKEA